MATIEVDLGFYIFQTILTFFLPPPVVIYGIYKAYKNPEFWQRLKRQDWVYARVLNPVNKLIDVIVPISKIAENGEFIIFKNRHYFWPDMGWIKRLQLGDKINELTEPIKAVPNPDDPYKDVKGQRVFQGKHGKGLALFRWNDPFAQVWSPGNTILSIFDPGSLDKLLKMKALQMWMNADSMTMLMKVAIVIAVVGILATAGIGFTVFNMGHSVDHLTCVLQSNGNATQAALCR